MSPIETLNRLIDEQRRNEVDLPFEPIPPPPRRGSLPYVPINVPPPRSTKPALPENIKAAAGASKLPLHLIPPVFKTHLALALAFGARKYGAWNWRGVDALPVRASTYVAAMHRHLDAWASGEDVADDSGVDHMAHLAASCAILLDARAAGRFEDDRARLDLAAERATAEAVMAGWTEVLAAKSPTMPPRPPSGMS